MAIKKWIDEIKTDKSGPKSEAQLEPAGAPLEENFPGERRASAILDSTINLIRNGGVFYPSPQTEAAEEEINRCYKNIKNGGSDFEALTMACNSWVKAGRTAPAPPETNCLFSGSEK
ncbi:MAG: hypothetical protein WAW09_08545 [Smithella sp.]